MPELLRSARTPPRASTDHRKADHLALHLTKSLRRASTLDEEIRALVAGIDPRSADWILARWGYLAWPVPTLESLGAAAQRTRERVRQVVTLHEMRLRELRHTEGGLRLPLAERAVAVLSARGGMLDTSNFAGALHAEGITTSAAAMRVLVTLGAHSLAPIVVWDEASDLWLDASRRHLLHDGSLERARRRCMSEARQALRSAGAVSENCIADAAPLPPEQSVRLIFGKRAVSRVSGYVVPRVQADSRLTRYALDMVTVCPGLDIEDLQRGLRRVAPALVRVPRPVLRSVLEWHPAFRIEGRAIFLTDPDRPSRRLSAADQLLIKALRARGGAMPFRDVAALLSGNGIPAAYLLRASHAPWLETFPGGIALRGHHGQHGRHGHQNEHGSRDAAAIAPLRGTLRHLTKMVWCNASATRVLYGVGPSSVRRGLRLPSQLAARVRETTGPWTVHAAPAHTSSRAMTVDADREALCHVRPWLVAVEARAEQYIELVVSFAKQTLTLWLLPAGDATAHAEADVETRWVQERPRQAKARPSPDARATLMGVSDVSRPVSASRTRAGHS